LNAVGDVSVFDSFLTSSGLDLTISSSGGIADIENTSSAQPGM